MPGLLACARMLEDLLGHELPGQTLKAGLYGIGNLEDDEDLL